MPSEIEIPIVADALPRERPDDVSRCAFLTISAEEPSAGWILNFNGQSIPFLLLGLQGILYQPSVNQSAFTHPDEIDFLINTIETAIEDQEWFTVETGVLWVPTRWLDIAFKRSGYSESSRNRPERGDLFRVRLSLFRDLWRFTDNRLDLRDLLGLVPDQALGTDVPVPLLRYSPEETRVFAAWTERQFQLFPGRQGQPPP